MAKIVAQSKAVTEIEAIHGALIKMEPEFAKSLPPQITSQKFVRTAHSYLLQNMNLLNTDRRTLYDAFMKCAIDGLLPDGREAAIVAYGDKAAYLPMVAGICKKVRQSGEIKTFNALIVHKNDEFKYWVDEMGEHFHHKINYEEPGDPILTYAYASTKDDGFYFEMMTEKQMDQIEKMSKTNKIWKGPFRSEMKRKSAIKRLAKYRLPMSTDLERMVNADNELFHQEEQEEEMKNVSPTRLEAIVESEDIV